jgi:uncharacterized protein (DUF1800 family)
VDTSAALRRLYVRTTFTAPALTGDFNSAVDAILTAAPDATPLPVLDSLVRPAKTDTAARKDYHQAVRDQARTLTLWWLDRLVTTTSPWIERRTLLWHNHWATSLKSVKWPAALLKQNDTERRLGGGDFLPYAQAMVVDPALMVWLDATGNTAKAPNENLARELMELFVLGHGNYSENDVKETARALTGWRIRRADDTPASFFAPDQHSTGTQTILGTTKDFEVNDLVSLLVGQPASPRYLAARMWGWIVADTPPTEDALARVVAAYGESRDLTAMFRALLTEPAFTDPGSVLVKPPIEYAVGALRALNVRPANLDEKARTALLNGLNGMGQVPFQPPNVGGWPRGTAWLTTAAAQARVKLAAGLARVADISAVAAARPGDRPEAAAGLLGVGEWTPRTRAVLADAAAQPAEVVTLALIAPEYTVSG